MAKQPSAHEQFWQNESFAFVGDSEARGFPTLSYKELRDQGRRVYPVDPSRDEIEGDVAYRDLASLPEPVTAAVLEVPPESTRDWVERAADAGVKQAWIHMGRETPEALELARERGVDALTGTCAVMYVIPRFTFHSLHKWINQLSGRY